MPWHIRKNKTKFEVVKDADGSVVGEHDTREAARLQLAALYASENGKGINLSYVKSMGRSDEWYQDVAATKSTGGDEITGYLALWGGADLEMDFFTPQSDFWDKVLPAQRPLTWNHGSDRDEMQAPDVIGQIVEMHDDEIGRAYTAILDRQHKYRALVDKLIKQRLLGTSSDSAPQYVIRQPEGKGYWLKQWPIFGAALTDTPCEPRMLEKSASVDVLKSLGFALTPDAPSDTARAEIDAIVRHLNFYDLLTR